MPSIFARELAARFGGYRPSEIDHARAIRSRDGLCLCGVPVNLHFDDDNRKISCDEARIRFDEHLEPSQ